MTSFRVTRSPDGLHVEVPSDLAFFVGHFASQPIVPGAALLQLVLQQLGDDDGSRVARLRRVRFLRPVQPGMQLDLRIENSAGDEALFTLSAAGATMAHGSIGLEAAP